MAEKMLNTRIALKIDTLENWMSSTLPLKKGELALATVAASAGTALTEPVVMMKVGEDGVKTFKDLEWNMYAKASDVLAAAKSEAALTAFVSNVITGSGLATNSAMTALSGRVTAVENELNTAATGLKARMTAAEGEIDSLQGLVGDKSVAAQIQEKIDALKLGETYAAKSLETTVANHVADTVAHVTSDDKIKWNNALQAADVATGSANGTISVKGNDVAIKGLGSAAYTDSAAYDAAGSASAAETAAKAYADGLAGNYDAKGAAATAESNAKAYADGLAGNYDAAGSAAQALVDAKAYTDGEIEEWVGDEPVADQISTAIAELKLSENYDTKGAAAAAESAAKAHADGLNTAMNTRVEALEAIDHEHANKAELDKIVEGDKAKWDAMEQNAKDYADGLDEVMDGRVAALEAKFGDGEGNVEAQIAAAVAAETKAREEADASLDGRVAAIEADYLKASDKTELQGAIDDLEELVGGESVATQIKNAVDAEAAIARAAEQANAAAIDAIEADYLKAADKTELQGNIDTVNAAVERLTNGVSAEEVDGVNDLIAYVKEHGTEVTGMKNDIKANADAIDAIEADYLKAADKTELQNQITANDGDISALQTAVGTKAAQADLESLAGRVTIVEGDLNTETTGLKDRVTAAEADIDALETKVGDEPVADQITAAIEALKIGDYAKAADLTAAVARIAKNETDIAALGGRMDTAEGEIDALQTEVAKKANDADLAAIAKTGNVNDLVQTTGDVLVFDCGTSAV